VSVTPRQCGSGPRSLSARPLVKREACRACSMFVMERRQSELDRIRQAETAVSGVGMVRRHSDPARRRARPVRPDLQDAAHPQLHRRRAVPPRGQAIRNLQEAATTSAGPRSTAAKGSYATATATGWKTVARRRCTRKSESRSRNLVVQSLVLSEPVSPSRFPGDPCVRGAERRLRYGYRERRGCQRPGRPGRGPR
jgi:hypothetical protein